MDYRVTGDRFVLRSEPTVRLPAAQDAKGDALRWLVDHAPTVVFAPMRSGLHAGSLTATVRETNEQFLVALRGKARLANEPADNAEVAARRAEETDARREQELETARQEKLEKQRIADDRKRPGDPPRIWTEDWTAALDRHPTRRGNLAKAQPSHESGEG